MCQGRYIWAQFLLFHYSIIWDAMFHWLFCYMLFFLGDITFWFIFIVQVGGSTMVPFHYYYCFIDLFYGFFFPHDFNGFFFLVFQLFYFILR